MRSDTDHTRLTALVCGTGLLLVGILVGVLAVTAGPGSTGELRLDIYVSQHRGPVVIDVAEAAHVVFGPRVAPAILLAVCVALWFWRRSAAVLVGVLTVVGWWSVVVGKWAFARPRPPADVVDALVDQPGADSFPSGHTAYVTALVCALLIARVHHGHGVRVAAPLGALLVALVAASRLVVGAHFYLDVLGAPFFVVGTLLIVCGAARERWRRIEAQLDGVDPENKPAPAR